MKKITFKILNYLLVFIILIGSYIVLGTFSSMMSSSKLKENVVKSSETLYDDGERKVYELYYKQETIFTFTDALMINTAYSIDYKTPIKSFLLARKNYIPGQTLIEHIDSQYNLGASEQYINRQNGDIYQSQELYGLMHGEKITDSFEYARYWHGYLVLLRPLLLILDYAKIRILQQIIMICLIAVLAFLLYKKIDLSTAIFYLMGFLAVCIYVVANSINESWVFIVAIIFTIILLLRKDKVKDISLFFFIIGSITNFIDLLTAPLVTLGIVATTYFLLLQKENSNLKIKDYIIEMIKVCSGWILGYGLTWLAKWIIVQFLYNRDLIAQAFEQAKYRTVFIKNLQARKYITVCKTINKNLCFLTNYILIVPILLFTGTTIYGIVQKAKGKINLKVNLKSCVPYIIIFLMPFVWYIVLKQHSYIHAFFTYRILIIAIINILIIIKKIFSMEEEIRKEGSII